MVLFGSPPAYRHAWAGVRALAWAAAVQVPGTSFAVVGLEAQRAGRSPIK